MASLSATTSYACQGTQGVITLSEVADAPGAPDGGEYSWVVAGSDGIDYGGPVSLGNLPTFAHVPDGATGVRVYATYPNGATAVSTPRSYSVSCSCNSGGGGGTTPGPEPVVGCTAPNALNYNTQATQDTDPTSCVFVEVPVGLSGLVAAHLPIPVVVRAAPTLAGLASIVVLVLQTAPAPTTPDAQWVTFGRLRALCDEQARASFNLSEAAKQLLSIAPPVESGIDPSLSVLVRARYQVLDPETLAMKYEGLVGTCRALNAVVQPVEGAVFTTATPYATVPTGKRLWQSTATYASGVSSALLTKAADSCQAREFVWLSPKGVWDQGLFFGKHAHTTENDAPIAYRDLAGADRYSSRGSVKPSLQVYSDVTDWATYQLLQGVRKSIQVYERLGPGQYVPVLLAVDNFPEYTELSDKTFQVNFTVSYPALLIQTQ